MTETAIAIGTPLASSGAKLKGNARGAMVCALCSPRFSFPKAAFAMSWRAQELVSRCVSQPW